MSYPAHRFRLLAAGLLVTTITACATGESDPDATAQGFVDSGATIDSGPTGGRADAAPMPDADPSAPDAAPMPDAAALPDAALPIDAPSAADAQTMVDAAPGTPDAMPMVDAGCTVQMIQLLQNANFDNGSGPPWTQIGSTFDYIVDSSELPTALVPQSGAWAAWMGGELSITQIMYQDVAIPAGATGLQLVGYRWFASEETTAGAWDTFDVEIRTTSSGLLERLSRYDNEDTTTAWTAFTLLAGNSYPGQTVRMYFAAVLDDSLNTNFFFDTLALRVTVCQ